MSRCADVEGGLADPQTCISGRGAIIELIKADIEFPPGVLIFEDPPIHTAPSTGAPGIRPTTS